jgi:CRP-like cAMP-binding protein
MSRLHPVSDEAEADSCPVVQRGSLFQIQQLLKGLKIWKDLDPNVQQKLPTIVKKASQPQGSTVFAQGDLPGHCYIVMSGEVAIWIKDEDATVPEPEPSSPSPANSARSAQSAGAKLEKEPPKEQLPMQRARRGSVPAILPQSMPARMNRRSSLPMPTAVAMPNLGRRHSMPSIDFKPLPVVNWGKQVATLAKGAIFGELALLNGQPRSASVTCITNCEFLIIERAEFDAVLKREMERFREEKLKFMKNHIPGVRDLPPQRLDKTMYCLVKETFPKGHVFLRQDEVAQRSVILVLSGNVELCCKQKLKQGDQETCCVARLVKGGLFGSSPSTLPEPFTATAAKTACEVYSLNERSLKRMPIAVIEGIRKYIAETTLWHLQSCTSKTSVLSSASLNTRRPSTPKSHSSARRTSSMPTRSRPSTPTRNRPSTPTRTGQMSRNRPGPSGALAIRNEAAGQLVGEVLLNGKFVRKGIIDFEELRNSRPPVFAEKGRNCPIRGQSELSRSHPSLSVKKHKRNLARADF